MKRAAVYQLVSKYASILVQLVITAILSRLVTPEGYGLIAIVTVFTSFFSMLSDMGVGTAVIQFRDLTERDLGGLFSFSCILGIALVFVFCLMSVPIAWFYGEAELVGLCCAASPLLLFTSLNMVPNGVMLRERRFAAIGVRTVVANVVAGAIAIALAAAGWGAYALAAQVVMSSLFIFVWNMARRPLREVNVHFMAPLRRVFSYSAWQFGFSFINYFSNNLDKLVLGRAFGAAQTGLYERAYKLSSYPVTMLAAILNPIIQPYMAEHQDDTEYLYRAWRRVTKLLTLASAPLMAAFVCCSDEITELFYGRQWDGAAPLLAALSISLFFRVWVNTSGAFFQSAGRTDIMFRGGAITAALSVAGLIGGLAAGSLVAVATCISVARIVNAWFVYCLLVRGLFGKGLRVLLDFLPELACSVAACAAVFLLAPVFGGMGWFVGMLLKFAVIGVTMLVGYRLTGQLRELRQLLGR